MAKKRNAGSSAAKDHLDRERWLAGDQPLKMLTAVRKRASDRKLRLFAVAVVRPFLGPMSGRAKHAVLVAERCADDPSLRPLLAEAGQAVAAARSFEEIEERVEGRSASKYSKLARSCAYVNAWEAASNCLVGVGGRKEVDAARHAALLRCLFGDAWREEEADPRWLAWNDRTVEKLAQSIYDDRAFDRLPILADALEDAGCRDKALVAHCRDTGPHARGCWVLDVLLDREGPESRGWKRVKALAKEAKKRLFLPHPGWLITCEDCGADDHPLGAALEQHTLNLIVPPFPEVVLDRAFDPTKARRDARVRSVQEVWFVTTADEVWLPEETAGRPVSGPHGTAWLFTDHERALAEAASVYEPLWLVLDLRRSGPAPARPFASAVLAGEEGALDRLADALDKAGVVEAQTVRRLTQAVQLLATPTPDGRAREADLELQQARLTADTEPCPGCGQFGRRSAFRVQKSGPNTGKLFIKCDQCRRFEWFSVTAPAPPAPPAAEVAAPATPAPPDRQADGNEELEALRRSATPCPKCGKSRRAFRVKKEGKNHGRLFLACSDRNCDSFEWAPAGGAVAAPRSEDDYLRAVHAAPDDDAPRLAYADWLAGNGRKERAELIRVQCESARRPGDDARAESLADRAADLIAEHGNAWAGPVLPFLTEFTYERGMLSPDLIDATVFDNHGADLTRAWTGHDLTVGVRGWEDVKRLAASPHLARLRGLNITGQPIGQAGGRILGGTAHLSNLTSLGLAANNLRKPGVNALANARYLVRLTALDLSGNRAVPNGYKALAQSPYLSRLTALRLADADLNAAEAEALANAPSLRNLTRLSLAGSNFGPKGLRALAASTKLTGLTDLDLSNSRLGPEAGTILAASPMLPRLTDLNLDDNQLGDAGVAALAAAPEGALATISLTENDLTAQGVRALAGAPLCARLTSLGLGLNALGTEGAGALAASSQLAGLGALFLPHTGLGPAGARRLASSPHLHGLSQLDLACNALGAEGTTNLAGWAALDSLVDLNLTGNDLGADGARALASSPHLGNLRSLNLDEVDRYLEARKSYGVESPIGDAGAAALGSGKLGRLNALRVQNQGLTASGAAALAGASVLSRLTTLDLAGNRLGDDGIKALAASPHLRRLTTLNLSKCAVGCDGLAALLASPHLARLTRLDLRDNPFGDAGVRLLAASPRLGRLSALYLAGVRFDETAARELVRSSHLVRAGVVHLEAAQAYGPLAFLLDDRRLVFPVGGLPWG